MHSGLKIDVTLLNINPKKHLENGFNKIREKKMLNVATTELSVSMLNWKPVQIIVPSRLDTTLSVIVCLLGIVSGY